MYLKKYFYSGGILQNDDEKYKSLTVFTNTKDNRAGFHIVKPTLQEGEEINKVVITFLESESFNTNKTRTYTLHKDYDSNTLVDVAMGLTSNKEDYIPNGEEKYYKLNIDVSKVCFNNYTLGNSNYDCINVYLSSQCSNDNRDIINLTDYSQLFSIYVEVVGKQRINSSSKMDSYSLDSDSKITVNRENGDLFYSLNLLTSLSKKSPINISLIGGKMMGFSRGFLYNLMYSFDTKFIKATDNSIYKMNVLGTKERYFKITDTTKLSYALIIKHISSNTGTIYFDEVNSSYLYNYEEDGVEYIKLYDKMDNCYLYQFVSGYTNLIKVTSNTGRVQNFTWSSNKLVGITNDDNDSISITYNLDNTVSILDNRTTRLVELSFENGIFVKYYDNNTTSKQLLKSNKYIFDQNNYLYMINESRDLKRLYITYANNKVSCVELKETIVNESTGIATFKTLDKVSYSYKELYTNTASFIGKEVNSYFNDLKRLRLEMDEKGKYTAYEYNDNTEQLLSNVSYNDISTSSLISNGHMSITEDSLPSSWTIESEVESNVTIEAQETDELPCFGDNYLLINQIRGNTKVYQNIIMEGGTNDVLLLTSFIKHSSIVDIVTSIKQMYLKYNYVDGSNETFRKDITLDNDKWELISCTGVASKCYSSVEVGFEVEGAMNLCIDFVNLVKSNSGDIYSYDAKNNIIEVLNSNSLKTNISYNESNKVSYISDSSGNGYSYFYDTKGRLEKIKSSNGTQVLLEYDGNDNITRETVTNTNGETIATSSTYDNYSNLKTLTDSLSRVYTYSYDSLDRMTQEIKPYNNTTQMFNYSYTKYNELQSKYTTIGTALNKNEISYLDNGLISSITCLNGNVYSFVYDDLNNLEAVKLNGYVLNTYEYEKMKGEIYTGLVISKTYVNGDTYNFEYTSDLKLKKVYLNSTLQYTYNYNTNGDLISIVNHTFNNEVETFEYENSKVKKTTSLNKEINYVYDNRNNIQKVNYDILDDNRSVEHKYLYENTLNSLDKYATKFIDRTHYDVVYGNKKGYGVNGLEPSTFDADEVVSSNLNVYKFTKENQNIEYSLYETNSTAPLHYINGDVVLKSIWDEGFNYEKEFLIWVRPLSSFARTTLMKLSSYDQKYSCELFVDEEGYLNLSKNENNDVSLLKSTKNLNIEKWNLIIIKFDKIILNTEEVITTLIKTEKIDYLSLGNYNIGSTQTLTMPYEVALMGVGYPSSEVLDPMWYIEGLKVLNNQCPNIEQSIYEDVTLSNKYEIYSLNDCIHSNRNNKLRVNYNKEYYPFEYNKNTSKFVLSSYKYNEARIEFKPKIINSGFISFDFNLDSLNEYSGLSSSNKTKYLCGASRYLLSNSNLTVYINNSALYIRQNGSLLTNPINITYDEWHKLSIHFYPGTGNSELFLDTTRLCCFTTHLYTEDAKWYIGASNISSNNCFGGKIKDLFISNVSLCTPSNGMSVVNEVYSLSRNKIINTYDSLGRRKIKTINTRSFGYQTNVYTYNKDHVLTERVLGLLKAYTYDNYDNIKTIKENNVLKSTYYYDEFNRLERIEEPYQNIMNYYDVNGNIDAIVQTKKSGNGTNIIEDFIYDNLKRLTTVNVTKETENITYELTYQNSNPNPNALIINDVSKEILYEGKRIVKFGTSEYKYNNQGIRTYKLYKEYGPNGAQINQKEYNYILEGNRIIKEILLNGYSLDYNYDLNGELVGFNYNGVTYFYIKNILGIIEKIIDERKSTYKCKL